MTILRSAIFFAWFAAMSALLTIGFLPVLLLPRRIARAAPKTWCCSLLWGLRIFAGLRYEIRGALPPNGALIAAKHMSMLDTLVLYAELPDSVFVLKRELLNVPLYGWYARKMGMIAIDREGRASALRKMAAAARAALECGREIVIFPEGTRRKPGAEPDYKSGVAGLYGQLGVPCIPVALNSGLFWTGPAGFLKKRGTVVVEFLNPIPAGLARGAFMKFLTERIETGTARLVAEGRRQLAGR